MPKEIPDCPKKPDLASQVSHTYEMELKTPLFGGGAAVRVNDSNHPIRGSGIRGQLRFWWRATRGRRCSDASALWLREEEIFGTTRFPSPVQVRVKLDPNTVPAFADAGEIDRFGPDGYALFPLQPGDQVLRERLRFGVTISWLSVAQLKRQRAALNEQLAKAKQPLLPTTIPDIAEDLRDAVWAWVNFGGLGGRTRRGCGTLWCKELAPETVSQIDEWFRAAQDKFPSPAGSIPLWPRLGEHLWYAPQASDAVRAWLRVMEVFRTFRQGKNVGRNPGQTQNRPGRSRFPEPETIRETIRQQGQRGGTHPPLGDVPKDAFPRAEFGLPIVFHFQQNEIPETVLYPRIGTEQPERMASPLILKALCLANGSAVPAILPLDVPWFTAVDLTLGGRSNVRKTFPLSAVRRPDLGVYTNPPSPLAGSPTGSAIEAFLAFAQSANTFRRA